MNNKKEIYSWCLYDWANSAYATVVLAAFLPIFYSNVASSSLTPNQATIYWSYTITVALILIAILSPITGAITDRTSRKKLLFKMFVGTGVIFTCLLYFTGTGDWFLVSIIFIVSNIGYALAEIIYNSFLKFIAPRERINYVSTLGYAFGYLGGGALLGITIFIFMGLNDFSAAARVSFLAVGFWWAIFTVPLLLNVREPKRGLRKSSENYIIGGFRSLHRTYKDLRRFRELFIFLIAFWLYNDGIGTIIKLAAIYGAELGISPFALIGALLATQLVGAPFTLLFSKLAGRIGTKNSIFVGLCFYLCITVGAYFISNAVHFWIAAIAVGMVQGGTQALSRSFFASMAPLDKANEFFGFYGMSSRLAGVFGPLFFAVINQMVGSSRLAVLSLILFFIAGIVVLMFVDEEKGLEAAGNY